MPGLRRYQAKALYSPFGLAWLRARDNQAATAYRDAPWPTSPLLISCLRLVQKFRSPRHAALVELGSAQHVSYLTIASTDARGPVPADISDGPLIVVSGRVTPENIDLLMLAIARVRAEWPEVAWRFDVEAQPAWLANALAVSAPACGGERALCTTLRPPESGAAVEAFVAQALAARVPGP